VSIRRVFEIVVSLIVMSFGVSVCGAQDFSTYRDFHLGADVQEIGQHIGSQKVDVRVIYQRPVVIEEFDWKIQHGPGTPVNAESLREIKFSFYDHQLFRMVVLYEPRETDGLTDEDVMEAISTRYGKATALDTLVNISSLDASFPDKEKGLAVWDGLEYSYTLYKTTYSKAYGLIVVSKAREGLAKTASEESIRLDKIEAPQRALELQKKQDADQHEADDKARLINKPKFRP
jgi:hypothetical protein